MPIFLKCSHSNQDIPVAPDMLEPLAYEAPVAGSASFYQSNPYHIPPDHVQQTYSTVQSVKGVPSVRVAAASEVLYDNRDQAEELDVDEEMFNPTGTIRVTDSTTDYLDVTAPLDEAIAKHLVSKHEDENAELLNNFLAHFRGQDLTKQRYTCAFLEVAPVAATSMAPVYDRAENHGLYAETEFGFNPAVYDNPTTRVPGAYNENPFYDQASTYAAARSNPTVAPALPAPRRSTAANTVSRAATSPIPLLNNGFVVFPCGHVYSADSVNKFRESLNKAANEVRSLAIINQYLRCTQLAACNASFIQFEQSGFGEPLHFEVATPVVQQLLVGAGENLYVAPDDVDRTRKPMQSAHVMLSPAAGSWWRNFCCSPPMTKRKWALLLATLATGGAGLALLVARFGFGSMASSGGMTPPSASSSTSADTSCLTPREATLFAGLQQAIPSLSSMANVTCVRIAEAMTNVCAGIEGLNPAGASVQDYSQAIASGLSVLGSVGVGALQLSQINSFLLACVYSSSTISAAHSSMSRSSTSSLASFQGSTTVVPSTTIETTTTVITTTTPTTTTSSSTSTPTTTTTTATTTTFVGTTFATVTTANAATSTLNMITTQNTPVTSSSIPVPTTTTTATILAATTATTQVLTTLALTDSTMSTLLQPTTTTSTSTTTMPATTSQAATSASTLATTPTTIQPTTTITSTATPTSLSSSTTTTTSTATHTSTTSTSTTTTTVTTTTTTRVTTTLTTRTSTRNTPHANTPPIGGGRRRRAAPMTASTKVDHAASRVTASALKAQTSVIDISNTLNAFTTPQSWGLWATQKFSDFWHAGTGRAFTLITPEMTHNLTKYLQNQLLAVTGNATRYPTFKQIGDVSYAVAQWFTEQRPDVAQSQVKILGPLGLFKTVSRRFVTDIIDVNVAIAELLRESLQQQFELGKYRRTRRR